MKIKKVIGWVTLLICVSVGVYIGFYDMFIGGIIDITEALKADVVDKGDVFEGIMKILFAGPSALVFIIVGLYSALMCGSIRLFDTNHRIPRW